MKTANCRQLSIRATAGSRCLEHSLFASSMSPLLIFISFLAMLAVFPSASARSTSIEGKIPFSKQQLHAMGIRPDEVRMGFFVLYKNLPSSMQAETWENPKLPRLAHVLRYAGSNQSLWLKTRCEDPSGRLGFDECHGSVCKPLGVQPLARDKVNGVVLRGEFGQYVMESENLAKKLSQPTERGAEICQLSWPAWAVKAKSTRPANPTKIPTHLLILQTDSQLIWIDALQRSVWNRTDWPVSRSGLFSSMEVDDSGKLILKNESGVALLMDFKTSSAFLYNNHAIRIPAFGLASVFGHSSEWSQLPKQVQFPETQVQNTKPLDINLAGLWWPEGFLTWNAVKLSASAQKEFFVREYEQKAKAASASWSSSSGVDKTFLSFIGNQSISIVSVEDNGTAFLLNRKIASPDAHQSAQSSLPVVDDHTFALRDPKGHVVYYNNDRQTLAFVVQPQGRLVQLGREVFVFNPKTAEKSSGCEIVHWRGRSEEAGWVSVIRPETQVCNAGVSRSAHSCSVVGPTLGGLLIHFLKDE